MHLHTTTVPTPVGPFTLLVDGDGVCAAGFTGRPETLQRRLDPRRRAAHVRPATDPDALAGRMLAYLEGEAGALDEVVVAQPGDPARQAAWEALRTVPAGRTVSYKQLGAMAGLADKATDPLGAQAAGAACAGNHVAVIVPCHRVLRADGRLGGYGWGTHRKAWLLSHEQALVPMPGMAGSRLRVRRVAGRRARLESTDQPRRPSVSPTGRSINQEDVDMAGVERQAHTLWEGPLIGGKGDTEFASSGIGRYPVTWAARTQSPEGKTSPEELLAAAHATCYAMAFSGFLAQAGNAPERLHVTSTVSFEPKEGGGFAVTRSALEVNGVVSGYDQDGFQQAAEEAEKGCPISNAIRGNLEITVKATLDS